MTFKKVVRFFQEKIGVTPPVAAPGETNTSDVTECDEPCRVEPAIA